METVRILTDAGEAYFKPFSNRQNPHHLALEWIGTRLAEWFGLPVLEYGLLKIDATRDEIILASGEYAETGRGFVTKEIPGQTWQGTSSELSQLGNLKELGRLVVFDTWVRNYDRCPPETYSWKPNIDNLFILDNAVDKPTFVAIDYTHCMADKGNLSKVNEINQWQDNRLYGLFPEFVPHVFEDVVDASVAKLKQVNRGLVETMTD